LLSRNLSDGLFGAEIDSLAVELLSEKGGGTRIARNRDGHTALNLAIPEGHVDIAQYLIEKGATSRGGWNALLAYASYQGNVDIVQLTKAPMQRIIWVRLHCA